MTKKLRCPLCGGEIMETDKGFSCSNWRDEDGGCNFTIWKQIYGAEMNENDVEALLNGETIEKENVSKMGNRYPVTYTLDEHYKPTFTVVKDQIRRF